ncbi:MAG: phospholipid carrier-dependent glycosyltransferase, partial [Candidatus Dormibacteraeota bacterium]|nr:phospholipid carrier-dependent glycosyltransferase [Candidatus Dormibacteraeota bacterium]
MSDGGEEALPVPRDLEPDARPREPTDARPWILRRLDLERPDLLLMGAFLVVAFAFRFFSPLMPDIFARPFQSAPVSNCVTKTPVDTQGHLGTLCGLAYPYQPNTAKAPLPPSPAEGEVFDEIYFADFAHDDLTGVSYFDPEPPLAKEVIAAGEWLDGAYRGIFQGAHGSFADLGFNTVGWRIMVCIVGTLCVPLMY